MSDFNIREKLQYPVSVTKTKLTVLDRRTGLKEEHYLIHPGSEYPIVKMGQIACDYGFEIVSHETLDTVTGYLPWGDLYDYVLHTGEEHDRPEYAENQCPG